MGKPILIVDDSASIRQMLSFTLKSAGYEVDEAADGKEGLGKAQSKSYSLVHRPEHAEHGRPVADPQPARNLAGYRSVPILMLTTESSDAMKQQGRSAGATGWLVKPFDPPKLLEVTRKVLP